VGCVWGGGGGGVIATTDFVPILKQREGSKGECVGDGGGGGGGGNLR